MNVFSRLIKLLVISTAIIYIFLISQPAYAKNITAGFGAETLISTPKGDVPVENLRIGDRVIGYNFATHHVEENIVTKINHRSSVSYFLINHQTKITGTSSVYVKTEENPILRTVQQLKLQDRLFSHDHSSKLTKSVTQIVQPTEIYQIYLNNQIGNLFADNILIHDGDQVPNLFRQQYLKCESHEVAAYNRYGTCANINSDNFLGFFQALAILLIGIVGLGTLIAKLLVYILNLIRFSGKEFTNNSQLIEFTQAINPNFTNKYSLKYFKSNKVWHMISLQPEISQDDYQHLVEKKQLIEQVNNLFSQYHQDIVYRNWDKIPVYFPKFTEPEKRQKFVNENNYIIYSPRIIEAAIIKLELKADKINVLTVQINAEKIYFVISHRGYVLNGNSEMKRYSEYWDIQVTSENRYLIKDINDTLTTVMLEGDLRARREAYGDFTGA